MKRFGKMITAVCAALMMCISVAACGGDTNRGQKPYLSYNAPEAAVFDCAARDGSKTQYLKKFDQFATTWSFVGDLPGYTRASSLNQLPALTELNADSLRFDLFMGYTGLGYNIGRTASSNGSTDAEYAQTMEVISRLDALGILPQLVLFACPAYAQPVGDWKSVPIAEKWRELCGNMATYFKEKDIRIGAYEMWNEPDFGTQYFLGDWEEYIDTYLAGAAGVYNADPDAFVQALSASWIHKIVSDKSGNGDLTKWESFIKRASDADLLPDSISWHFYGREGKMEDIVGVSGDGENFSVYRNAILNAITASQNGKSEHDDTAYDLSTLQQHLNEFNIYAPLHEDSRDMWNTTALVPGMFSAIETLLAANDITRVNWATFMSEQTNGIGCSAVDLYSLQRYPAYHVNWMYGRLPINRIVQPTLEDGLFSMAGVDAGRAGIIVYNSSAKKRTASVKLTNLPFENGNVSAYLVDTAHLTYSTQNEPYLLATSKNVASEGLSLTVELEPDAVCYLEVNDAAGTLTDTSYNPLSKHIVRKDYWYPSRGDNTPYSDIHERSLMGYAAMNDNAEGKSAVSVQLKDMTDKTLTLDWQVWGEIEAKDSSALGVKIDFMTDSGYTESVYWSLEGFSSDIALPFGNKGFSTVQKTLTGTEVGKETIVLSEYAPAGWTGRIAVSYVISDAGKSATASFKIAENQNL